MIADLRAFIIPPKEINKVYMAGIYHMCVLKGRLYKTDPAELEAENRLVLDDLIEIKKKFQDKLKDAPWNK